MRLEIKDCCHWRYVCTIQPGKEANMRQYAVDLAKASNRRAQLRVVDDKDNTVAECEWPDFEWKEMQ